MKKFLVCATCLFCFLTSSAQQVDSINTTPTTATKKPGIYKMKYKVDIPLTAAGVGWTLFAFTKIYGRDRVPDAEILALVPANVNSFDRPVTMKYSEKAKSSSDLLFYGSMPAPLLLLLDKKIRKDAPKIGLLYLEAMAITGTVYTSTAMIVNRFRPYAYNPNVPMGTRTSGGSRNSFPSGHPAVVATSTFFMAKVYSDYHPEMKNKWILYGVAGGASLATGILRIQAGQHFITDVMTGIPLGVLSGILVPHFHKRKQFQNYTVMPYYQGGARGFTALVKLNTGGRISN